MLPWLPESLDEIKDIFGGDRWLYGVEENRITLEEQAKSLQEQIMFESKPTVDEFFAPVSLTRLKMD